MLDRMRDGTDLGDFMYVRKIGDLLYFWDANIRSIGVIANGLRDTSTWMSGMLMHM
jgi:hypothetical protein